MHMYCSEQGWANAAGVFLSEEHSHISHFTQLPLPNSSYSNQGYVFTFRAFLLLYLLELDIYPAYHAAPKQTQTA